jgi:hypothetical protein
MLQERCPAAMADAKQKGIAPFSCFYELQRQDSLRRCGLEGCGAWDAAAGRSAGRLPAAGTANVLASTTRQNLPEPAASAARTGGRKGAGVTWARELTAEASSPDGTRQYKPLAPMHS